MKIQCRLDYLTIDLKGYAIFTKNVEIIPNVFFSDLSAFGLSLSSEKTRSAGFGFGKFNNSDDTKLISKIMPKFASKYFKVRDKRNHQHGNGSDH